MAEIIGAESHEASRFISGVHRVREHKVTQGTLKYGKKAFKELLKFMTYTLFAGTGAALGSVGGPVGTFAGFVAGFALADYLFSRKKKEI